MKIRQEIAKYRKQQKRDTKARDEAILEWMKLAFILFMLAIALLLSGCVRVKLPDGTEYLRIGPQRIDGAIIKFPDGSELLLEGQKSELPPVEITATSITIGGKKVNP